MSRPRRHTVRSAFRCAFVGIAEFSRGRNSRIQIATGAIVLICGAAFRITRFEWVAILFATAMVLSLEAINTAIEHVVDLASPGEHELARRAKDVAAGAVLMASIAAVGIGVLIFGPHVIALLRISESP